MRSRDTALLGRLWTFVRPHARYLYASLGLLVVTAGAGLVRPLLMRQLIDAGAIARNPDTVVRFGWILLGIVVVEQVLTFYQVFTMQIAGARAMADLRAHLFQFLHTRRLGFFDRQPIGRLVTRVTNDTDAISEMFASGVLNAVGDLIRLVGIVAMMLLLDWRLSLIAFAALPPVTLFVNWMRAGSRRAYGDIRLRTAELNALLDEQVSGMAVVQALCHEDASAAEFDGANRGYRNAYIRFIKFEATIDAAIELVAGICVALLLVAAGFHAASVGTIVALIAYIKQFFEPVSNLAQRYTLLQSAMSGAEKVFEMLDTGEAEPKKNPGDGAPRLGTVPAAFSLEHVSFRYRSDVPVLHDVSLRAELGETIAVVGATGSGKTTVASLLLRLYEPEKGVVRVLGRDVETYDPSELRRQFAVVPQDVYLFPGTIASNVSVGARVPDRARVREALESVCALDLFERRPGGIDGPVDERGANFSAGERQLIAFARALYRDPAILVLDEATANIDSETESRVQKALSILTKGRTALVIAHRLSTIRAANRIVVLHKGRLVEEGTHEELLAKGGAYAKLYRLRYAQDAA